MMAEEKADERSQVEIWLVIGAGIDTSRRK